MKVVFLVASMFGGGVERTVSYLSEYFGKHEVETTVLSIGTDNFYEVGSNVKYATFNIPNTKPSDSKVKKIYLFLKRHFLTYIYMIKYRPDVVVCIAPQVTRYVMPLQKIGFFKVVTSERNNPAYDTKKEASIKRKAFSQCDGIVFQTKRAMECFTELVQSKGVVIPNAVGNELVYTASKPSVPKRKFSAVGRLTKQKDYFTMIRAFAQVHKIYPDYTLEIYGIGEDEDQLIELVKKEGVMDCVFFQGISKDAILRISDSTAFLLSSIYEGMPNVLMEALGVGLPCVSTDCPFGPAELIDNYRNGILVPVGNVQAFADAMKYIIENPAEAHQMGEKAKSILLTNNVDTIAERYLGYVKSVL